MSSKLATTAFITALLATNVVTAATVGLYSTPNCTSCNLNIPTSATEGRFYVCASETASEEFCGGSSEFEFRIEGLRLGWVVAVARSPLSQYALGDPFGLGCTIAFSEPQASECTLLYTVTITPSFPGARSTLRVRPHFFPTNPDFNCIRAVPACQGTAGICVDGGALLINSDVTCSVAVQSTSWASVKALYE